MIELIEIAEKYNTLMTINYGRIAGQYPIWVQTVLTTMVRMFEKVGLWTNLNQTKDMICKTGFVWGKQVVEAYKRQPQGRDQSFGKRRKAG